MKMSFMKYARELGMPYSLLGGVLLVCSSVAQIGFAQVVRASSVLAGSLTEDFDRYRGNIHSLDEPPTNAAVKRIVAHARAPDADAESLYWAAQACIDGFVDVPEVMTMLRRSADQRFAPAMTAYGVQLCLGERVPRDVQAGLKLMEQALEMDEPMAYYRLGTIHAAGLDGVKRDWARAEALLEQALKKGIAHASADLATLSRLRGDPQRMLHHTLRAADAGHPAMMRVVAQAYSGMAGTPLQPDPAKAVEWIRRGALLRHPALLRRYGQMLEKGSDGLPEDACLARRLLERSADLGDDASFVLLQVALLLGSRDHRADPGALALLETLAARGVPQARYQLGSFLYEGVGAQKDPTRGIALIEAAAAQRHELAIEFLARLDVAAMNPVLRKLPAADPPKSVADVMDWTQEDVRRFCEFLYRLGEQPSEQAVQRIIARANQRPDDPESLFWAAQAGLLGLVEVPNAVELLQRASERGFPPAVAAYGAELCAGVRIPSDPVRGLKLLEQAADKKEPLAMYHLGALYISGQHANRDLNRAQSLLKQAADGGLRRALRMLVDVHQLLGNTRQATDYGRLAALQGDSEMSKLAVNASLRPGDEGDPDRAVEWLRRGALFEDPWHMRMYAVLMEDGYGKLKQDPNLSRRLLQRAADRGDNEAAVVLQKARLTGKFGVPINRKRGLANLEWLADAGVPEAQWHLGRMLHQGEAMQTDKARGLRWIHSAADNGHPAAREFLDSLQKARQ